MLAARVICPGCGQWLTVSAQAPPRVSCPRCLAALVNPASPQSGLPPPLPVLPLDRQVERDARIGRWLTFGILGLLGFAAVLTFAGGNASSGFFVLLLVGGLATVLYFLGATASERPRAAREPPPVPAPAALPRDDRAASGVLEYGTPRPPRRPATAGAVTAGFFSAVGVCAAGFVVLLLSAEATTGSRRSANDYNALILAGVVVAVLLYIAATVRFSRRWGGFAPGAIAGLVLGLMALGPCAACYLLTLG